MNPSSADHPVDEKSRKLPASQSCPHLVEHLLTGFVTVGILEHHSRMPEVNVFMFFFAVISTLGLSIVYCHRLALLVFQERTLDLRRTFLHWLVLPLAVFAVSTSTAFHWTATVRFAFSKTHFEELVTRATNGERLRGFPRRIGCYWIKSVHDSDFDYDTGKGTFGFVTGQALIDDCGVEYDRLNPDSKHPLTIHIAPSWYLTEW